LKCQVDNTIICEGVIRNSYNDSFSGRNQNGAWNG